MNSVCIYGTGLIGGSLALALKRWKSELRLAGVDSPEVLERARQLNIIDVAGPEPADLTILATPVGEILRLLDEVKAPLITDVGSTKVEICKKAEGLPFIGGHPMAGLEHAGPEAANADLFKNAPFFLCPIKSTPKAAIETMKNFVTAMGAIPHVISPDDHDRLVAQISHLPQIVSSILAEQSAANIALAGPGLKSMTRLAGSPFHVWRDIFKTSGYLPHELQRFIQRLQSVLDSLETGNIDEIEKLFKRGGPS